MNETTDAIAIFAPLWRRKWLILAVAIVVGAATYLYYRHATRVFKATTQVYLGAGAEEQAPGEKTAGGGKNPASSVANQAQIINSIVAEKVRQRLRDEGKAKALRGSKIGAKGTEKSEFITITTEAHTAVGAAQLANLTAQTYVRRQHATRARTIEKAIAIARRQLHRIEASTVPKVTTKPAEAKAGKGEGKGSEAKGAGKAAESESTTTTSGPSTASILQAANLSSRINQLESSLGVAGAQQVKPAKAATTVQLAPKPRKNAIFGFVIGLVLASIAAYALSRFDRRLRSLVGIERIFGARTLAGLPKVRRPIVFRDGRPAPSRFLLEPLRRLHTSFQLAAATQAPANGQPSLRATPRVILFTSADAGDGKSTLVADLALVQRDANQRVVIVEANFRRPVQAKLLGLDAPSGLAEVLVGSLALPDALARVHYDEPPMPAYGSPPPVPVPPGTQAQGGVATMVESRAGSLALLAGGGAVSNPPALLGNGTMPALLRSLADDSDYVLIDAPSPLEVSDVMPLLPLVDGIVIVARAGHTREASAERLVELLARTASAPVLGVCANCVSRKEIERFGFAAAHGPGKLIGR